MAPVPGSGLRVPMIASGPGRSLAACSARSARISRCSTARPGSRPARNSCAACSTRAWPRRSSRPWRPPGRRAANRGCASTSPPNSPRPTPRPWTVSRRHPQHAVRRGAEMEAAAEMLTELGIQPLMADASRALHERLAKVRNSKTREPHPYASCSSASASGCSASGLAWCGRFTMIRSTPASRYMLACATRVRHVACRTGC